MPRKSTPSEINSVWFNREYGWTPANAKAFVSSHLEMKPRKWTNRKSAGGLILEPGTYIDVNVRTKRKGFTSCGFKPLSPDYPGVYFQFCGFRPQANEASDYMGAQDHLGSAGRYVVEFMHPHEGFTKSSLLPTQRDAMDYVITLEDLGGEALRVLEVNPTTGEQVEIWSAEG